MPRVVHFEIPADDPERAVAFYKDAFGWEISKWGGPMDYWLATTGKSTDMGIDGAIMRREDEAGVRNTIGVEDIAAARQKVAQAGGTLLSDVTPIPGIGWFCHCTDTEGNLFGMLQPDMDAK